MYCDECGKQVDINFLTLYTKNKLTWVICDECIEQKKHEEEQEQVASKDNLEFNLETEETEEDNFLPELA